MNQKHATTQKAESGNLTTQETLTISYKEYLRAECISRYDNNPVSVPTDGASIGIIFQSCALLEEVLPWLNEFRGKDMSFHPLRKDEGEGNGVRLRIWPESEFTLA